MVKKLTYMIKRHLFQFIVPVISCLDNLILVLNTLSRESLLSSMLHDLFEIIRIDGVKNVKEVGSTRAFVIRVRILEVNLKVRIFLQIGP